MEYKPPPVPEPLEDVDSESTSSSSSFFGRFFGWSATGKAGPPVPSIPEDVPKSLYLYGDVGCGKSMLMDLVGDASLQPL